MSEEKNEKPRGPRGPSHFIILNPIKIVDGKPVLTGDTKMIADAKGQPFKSVTLAAEHMDAEKLVGGYATVCIRDIGIRAEQKEIVKTAINL